METVAVNAALVERNGSPDLPESTALNGVKVMVIDDSNTIRRSAEIFLLQAGCTVILADDGFDALCQDHRSSAGPDICRYHDAAPRRLSNLRADQEKPEVPSDARGHAVVEGRAFRPGARPHGGLGSIPDQAVYQGESAEGGGRAREEHGVALSRRRFKGKAAGSEAGQRKGGAHEHKEDSDRRRLADRTACLERHADQGRLRSRRERQRRGRDRQGKDDQARSHPDGRGDAGPERLPGDPCDQPGPDDAFGADHHVHVEEPGNGQDLGPAPGRPRLHREAGEARRVAREDHRVRLIAAECAMARAAKLDLRAFQQELATRLAAKTAAQVEQSRLGVACGGEHWLIRLADAGEVIAMPVLASVPRTKPWYVGIANIRGNLYGVIDFAGFLGRPVDATGPGTGQSRLVLFGPRVGELRAGIIVHRVLGLRNLAELVQGDAQANAPAWYGSRWTDADGQTWQEIDLARLAQDPGFPAGGAVTSGRERKWRSH